MKVQLTIPSATRRFDLQKGCFSACVPSAIERRQRELGSKRGRGFESLVRSGRYSRTQVTEIIELGTWRQSLLHAVASPGSPQRLTAAATAGVFEQQEAANKPALKT